MDGAPVSQYCFENSVNPNPSGSGSLSVSGSRPWKADPDTDPDSDPESLDYRFLQFSCNRGAPAREQLFQVFISAYPCFSRKGRQRLRPRARQRPRLRN